MTRKWTGNDFDIASTVHGEINKNPWNKDEREQKTKFLPSLCFSGPEIHQPASKVSPEQHNDWIQGTGIAPGWDKCSKSWMLTRTDRVGRSGDRAERRSLWDSCGVFVGIVWRGVVSVAKKKAPPMETSPKPGRSLGCFGTSTAFCTTSLRVAPRRVASFLRKNSTNGVMEWWFSFKNGFRFWRIWREKKGLETLGIFLLVNDLGLGFGWYWVMTAEFLNDCALFCIMLASDCVLDHGASYLQQTPIKVV